MPQILICQVVITLTQDVNDVATTAPREHQIDVDSVCLQMTVLLNLIAGVLFHRAALWGSAQEAQVS
jgi:hypothetical protein